MNYLKYFSPLFNFFSLYMRVDWSCFCSVFNTVMSSQTVLVFFKLEIENLSGKGGPKEGTL